MPRDGTTGRPMPDDAGASSYRPAAPDDWVAPPDDEASALDELAGKTAGAGAPDSASYVTREAEAGLSNESVLAGGAGIAVAPGTADISLDINGLAEDGSPDAANDYLATYDASEAAPRKVKLVNLPGGAESIDDLTDVDTTTDPPVTDEVLKWTGTQWVPAAYDATFTFSIVSFTDNISDTDQLIGSGTWKAVGALTFQATYENAPGGMTAEVAMSGASAAWGGNLSMDPVTGPELNTEVVTYPAAAGGTVTFTLSQSVDATTKVDSVTFNNTMRYGNSALGGGSQTEASLEALSEVAGPNESRAQTIANIPTTANYLVFAYADRLSDVAQIRRDSGFGYVTASFNATRTQVGPTVQSGVANVANSAGYSETFACVTSTDTGLANGTHDFQLLTGTTQQNYLYWGECTVNAGGDGGNVYTEANVENNYATQPGKIGHNTISSRSMTINCAVDEYTYIAYPARLGALTSILIGGFQSIGDFWIDNTALAITNPEGFTENYRVYVSKNPGFTNPTTMTVSI